MKLFSHFRTLMMLAVGLTAASLRADAQGFGLSVTSSATSIQVSNSLTFTINVTNSTGFFLQDAVVTNTLPPSVQILNATNSQGTNLISGSTVRFNLGPFVVGGTVLLAVAAEPTAAGFITNTVTVASSTAASTASTNTVVLVTNAVIPTVDLGVMITGPAQAVITNDWTTYGVTATNLGPNAATSVVLTNTLPPGVILRGTIPANYTVVSSNLVFNLGTLASGGYTNLQFTIQPTNVATLLLSASIGSAVLDTNTANNFASTNVPVIAYLPGTLIALTNSTQIINFQNALTEQTITLSNAGPSSVPAARIVVTGLTNQLFNAVGTNNGSPFVYYSAQLAAGQSVSLLLQFYPRGYFPFTNSQLHAFAVPLPAWTPPRAASISTNINISRIVQLSNGNMLIEWPTTTNQTYTVVYSDNVLFSNAMIAPPSIVAPANRTQWIDYGPPTTVSAPTNASVRFYRVFQNP
ncbi:MAG: DUF11 domain-containing protein [Verrucomicrobiota bacterium]|jgi:uncharacterized repeat protein (TIGR01451 family)